LRGERTEKRLQVLALLFGLDHDRRKRLAVNLRALIGDLSGLLAEPPDRSLPRTPEYRRHRRPLPALAQQTAVITAPSGAAC
jgi:hypothetical protein